VLGRQRQHAADIDIIHALPCPHQRGMQDMIQ